MPGVWWSGTGTDQVPIQSWGSFFFPLLSFSLHDFPHLTGIRKIHSPFFPTMSSFLPPFSLASSHGWLPMGQTAMVPVVIPTSNLPPSTALWKPAIFNNKIYLHTPQLPPPLCLPLAKNPTTEPIRIRPMSSMTDRGVQAQELQHTATPS